MSQQLLHTLCVKQLMRATARLITPLVFAVVGVISAAPAHAQVQDIQSFADCLKSITAAQPTVADAANACIPAGCYTTVTLSQESAQPGCTLTDGTRLPRVIYSCQGPGGSQILRFRPSFTLCTSPRNLINHIELGEDVNSRHIQKMADVNSSAQGFTVVVDTPTNNTGCFDCHDRMGKTTTGVNLFAPVFPELAEGTIYTNDPRVVAPAVQTPLSDICTGIRNSSLLRNRSPDRYNLAVNLCDQLELKTH